MWIAFKTAVVLLFWPQSPAAPKEKLDPGGGVGPGVAVIVGVGPIVGVAVGVPVPPAPAQLTTSSRRFDAASFGLKAYWSLLAGFWSSASDISEPTLAATAEVMSTGIHAFTVDGVKLVRVLPIAGRVFHVIPLVPVSSHVVFATLLTFMTPGDILVTHIRRVACDIGSPAREVRSNLM